MCYYIYRLRCTACCAASDLTLRMNGLEYILNKIRIWNKDIESEQAKLQFPWIIFASIIISSNNLGAFVKRQARNPFCIIEFFQLFLSSFLVPEIVLIRHSKLQSYMRIWATFPCALASPPVIFLSRTNKPKGTNLVYQSATIGAMINVSVHVPHESVEARSFRLQIQQLYFQSDAKRFCSNVAAGFTWLVVAWI